MLKIPKVATLMFGRPTIIFTVVGNPISELVLAELANRGERTVEYAVFSDVAEAIAKIDPTTAVSLADQSLQGKCFTPCSASRQGDHPMAGAQWGVRIGPKTAFRIKNCVNQIYADFIRRFEERLETHMFPWGKPRKGEEPPRSVRLPPDIEKIRERLNDGPDLASEIADQKYSLELPAQSRISWIRLPSPFIVDREKMEETLAAFVAFEKTSDQLLRKDRQVQEMLLAGVELEQDSAIRDLYLYPNRSHFSIRRPDLHVTADGIFASENDEMPGGFGQVFHLDNAYGLHSEEWQRAFAWLTGEGPLLFVVSSEWSKCYITEIKWFSEAIARLGFPARMITTDRISELDIRADGVYDHEGRIGTIWRLFPIFETKEMLAFLVQAAHQGLVRMVPEFGHWGNKTWFSIFRSHQRFYESELTPSEFELLNRILPYSQIVRSEDDFPFAVSVNGSKFEFDSLAALRRLSAVDRSNFVLKVCGANDESARMYGVLMGHQLTDEVWQGWIDERMQNKQPFIVQTRFRTSVARIPVLNIKRECGELFNCRVLLRPWHWDREIVSVSATAVPHYTERIHGMVDMALGPVILQ